MSKKKIKNEQNVKTIIKDITIIGFVFVQFFFDREAALLLAVLGIAFVQ